MDPLGGLPAPRAAPLGPDAARPRADRRAGLRPRVRERRRERGPAPGHPRRPARRRLRGRGRALPHRAHPRGAELEPWTARAADRTGRGRAGGRLPDRRQWPAADGGPEPLPGLRVQRGQAGGSDPGRERRRQRRAHDHGRPDPQRGPAALLLLDRGQPAPRGRALRRSPGVRLHARHRRPRPGRLRPRLLQPARQAGLDPRRALQRRRSGGRLRDRDPGARGHEPVAQPRRVAGLLALGRHGRSQGHDHQRVRRLGRRLDALRLPAARSRPARRHAHLGRPGRDLRLPALDGRR